MEAGTKINFTIRVPLESEFTPEIMTKILDYGQYVGLGQFRGSGGFGRFTYRILGENEEIKLSKKVKEKAPKKVKEVKVKEEATKKIKEEVSKKEKVFKKVKVEASKIKEEKPKKIKEEKAIKKVKKNS
jgi:predicted transcriptional regulator